MLRTCHENGNEQKNIQHHVSKLKHKLLYSLAHRHMYNEPTVNCWDDELCLKVLHNHGTGIKSRADNICQINYGKMGIWTDCQTKSAFLLPLKTYINSITINGNVHIYVKPISILCRYCHVLIVFLCHYGVRLCITNHYPRSVLIVFILHLCHYCVVL